MEVTRCARPVLRGMPLHVRNVAVRRPVPYFPGMGETHSNELGQRASRCRAHLRRRHRPVYNRPHQPGETGISAHVYLTAAEAQQLRPLWASTPHWKFGAGR